MKSPFKFLDSYTREDRAVFFGRDQEITDLYRRVFESRMLLVYGISGTGKSSLVNCGLASRFDESDWLPVNVRRGNNIIESLNDAFNKQALTPLKKNQNIAEKIQSIYLDHFKPVYLLFDQFEELFIFGSKEEKEGFISIVREITGTEVQCRMIFIIREEFLAGMTEFEEKIPDIFTNRFRVEKMKRGNAISAVEGPCRVFGIEAEQGFSDELIDKLIPAGNEIELTYLQIYLDRIFRSALAEEPATSNIKFSKGLLAKAGSVSDLLGQFLDEQIREFEDPETGMTILKSFVSVQGTKKQMSEKDIHGSIGAFGLKIAEPDLIKYLEKYVELRILREKDEAGRYELRHDALASKIFEHFTLAEKELLEVRQFVENALQAFKTRRTYLSRDDIEYLSPYEKKLFLSTELEQFVKQSKDKLQSQQRALKRLTRIVTVIFLSLIALGIRYYFRQKSTLQTRELTTIALLQEQIDPVISMNTAFRVREVDTLSPVIQGIILRNLNVLINKVIAAGDSLIPEEIRPVSIPVSDSIVSMQMNKSGTCLYGWTAGMEIISLNLKSCQVNTFKVPHTILVIEMSDDAKYLAVVYKNSSGEVFTSEGTRLFNFQVTGNHLMNNRLVHFFPLGKYFIASVNGKTAEIYDSTGKVVHVLEGHNGCVNSLDISPDGRFVVTASSDKNALIWNYNHNLQKFTPYDTITGHTDTVWSCTFNKTGKFILTASADSMLRISDLNGYQRERFFTYSTNSPYGYGILFTPAEEKYRALWADTGLMMDTYNKRIYDARFAADDGAVIASNYSYNVPDSVCFNGLFHSEVVYFGQSYNNYYHYDYFLSKARQQYTKWSQQYISKWEISPDRQLFAAVPEPKIEIFLTTADGYKMMTIRGCFPCFSVDGRYLYYVNDRNVIKFPLDMEEIRSLVLDKNLFGNTEKPDELWLLL